MKARITDSADAKTSRLLWVGLALMSTQGGALAWLTWWVYSWDIMEPVTYFITYGSAMAFYAYFVLTKQVSPRLVYCKGGKLTLKNHNVWALMKI